MLELNSCKIVVEKSKFFGYLFEIDSLDEVKEVLEFVSNSNLKARHICYGVCFGEVESFKNDGEVGNPGKILLELLRRKGLKKHVLVVARFFGGVKLGPAGVGRTFRKTGEMVF